MSVRTHPTWRHPTQAARCRACRTPCLCTPGGRAGPVPPVRPAAVPATPRRHLRMPPGVPQHRTRHGHHLLILKEPGVTVTSAWRPRCQSHDEGTIARGPGDANLPHQAQCEEPQGSEACVQDACRLRLAPLAGRPAGRGRSACELLEGCSENQR